METPEIDDLQTLSIKEAGEVTYLCFLSNVDKLENKVESPPFMFRTMQWTVWVIPTFGGFGVFVHCCGKHDSPYWTCNATVEFRLLSFKGESLVKGPIKHLFKAQDDYYGYSNFVCWQSLLDMADAYVVNKGVLLEVNIIADASQG